MLQYILQERKLSDAEYPRGNSQWKIPEEKKPSDAEYPGGSSQWKIPEEQLIGSCSLTPDGRHLSLGRLRGFFPQGHSPLGMRASTSVPAGNMSIPT